MVELAKLRTGLCGDTVELARLSTGLCRDMVELARLSTGLCRDLVELAVPQIRSVWTCLLEFSSSCGLVTWVLVMLEAMRSRKLVRLAGGVLSSYTTINHKPGDIGSDSCPRSWVAASFSF